MSIKEILQGIQRNLKNARNSLDQAEKLADHYDISFSFDGYKDNVYIGGIVQYEEDDDIYEASDYEDDYDTSEEEYYNSSC